MAFAQAEAQQNRVKRTISLASAGPSGLSIAEKSKVKRAPRKPKNLAKENRKGERKDVQMTASTSATASTCATASTSAP